MKNEIYIGDNLRVMKSEGFRKYEKSINMLYIDPPYNTKSKLSYKDNLKEIDWLSELEDRLRVSKDFLVSDGLVFISIDDNEYAELKLLCDKVYGKKNYVGTFIVKQATRSNSKHINTVHEYILCYCKDKKQLGQLKIRKMDIPEQRKVIELFQKEVKSVFDNLGQIAAKKKLKELINKYIIEEDYHWLINYYNVDENGRIFFATDLSAPIEPNVLDIPEIGLHLDALPTRGWQSKSKFIELYNKGLLYFRDGRPYAKHYIEDSEDNVSSILNFCSKQGTTDLKRLGLDGLFDTPKSVELLKYLIRLSCKESGIVMDIYGGSGTTAQAVLEVNEEDKKENKFVLVQLDEQMQKGSKPYNFAINRALSPIISEAMLYRISEYCKKYKIDIDLEINNVK